MNGNAVSIHPSDVFAESLRTFFGPFRGNSTHALRGQARERQARERIVALTESLEEHAETLREARERIAETRERIAAVTESRENAETLPLLSFVVHVVVGTSLFLLVLVPVVLLQALLSTVTAAPLLADGLRVAQYALLATDTFLFLSLLVRSAVTTLRRV